jgi:Inositol polyphosphate kinase.
MVGGSLLVIYEADWDMAEKKFTDFCMAAAEGEEGLDGDEESEDDDDDFNDSKKPGPPYIVKLIDFAHTHITPGQGPDEGVLLGFKTVLQLLDGRIEQIRAQQ